MVLEYSITGVYTKNLSAASSPYTLTVANTISSAQADNENRQVCYYIYRSWL